MKSAPFETPSGLKTKQRLPLQTWTQQQLTQLDKETSRRRDRRTMTFRTQDKIRDGLKPKVIWRNDEKDASFVEKFPFQNNLLGFLFFLGFPGLLNAFAHPTGVLAVECLLDRLFERGLPRIIHNHSPPCDDLQDRPLTARYVKDGDDEQDSKENLSCFGKHG